jgi:hypothetical protein
VQTCLKYVNTLYEPFSYTVSIGELISFWLFLSAAQPKEFFLDRLKKLEQRSHKCVELGEYVNKFFESRSLLFSL